MDKWYAEKVERWLREHWIGDGRCPLCGGLDWGIRPIAYLATPPPQEWAHDSDPVYPVIQCVCATCGHIVLLDAVTVGIVPTSE